VNDLFSTIGREIYPGREVKLCCQTEAAGLTNECLNKRFRLVYVAEGFGFLKIQGQSQLITAPSVLCLNETDEAEFIESTGLVLNILYFEPTCFDEDLTFEILHNNVTQLVKNLWFFSPFMRRSDTYIGASSTNQYTGNRVSYLIHQVDKTLTEQSDYYWPCRSRSYFIELLILVNQIYSNEESMDRVLIGKMTDEVRLVVNYIHVHYPEKITMESITKAFHTNKTTINQKFKGSVGLTVIEYLNDFRMQIACSLLRRTELTVNEIMDRLGYKDDGHFLRSFKKYTHLTPSAYRTQKIIA
jgi:AraC-like DNA-binding protein